ncbi:MAG: hypothetical protein WBJ81_00200 [Rickettsiales bacterium]
MTLIDKYRKVEVLGDSFIYLSEEEELDFLFRQNEFGLSFLEDIILSHPDQISLIFNSELFFDLEPHLLEEIFKRKINKNDTLFSFSCSKNHTVLDILLNSKAFAKLTYLQQNAILKVRPVSDTHDIPLFIKATIRSDPRCLSTLVNSRILINLEQELIFDLLNDRDSQDKNCIQRAVKNSVNFNILLNSEIFQKLSTEYKFILLTNEDKNHNTLLFDYIHIDPKKKDPDFFKTFFENNGFKEFDESKQSSLLYLNQNSSKELWLYLIKKQNNIASFVEYSPKFLISSFVDFIKNYYWESCCQRDTKPDYIRNMISLSDILKAVNSSKLCKVAADSDNFSVLYYIASYGVPINEIKKYQQNGFTITAKDGYGIIIQEKDIMFTCDDAKGDILIINGKYTKNDIMSGLEAALHQSCYNILAVNANYNPFGKDIDIGAIISNYSRKSFLDFIIINAHGTRSNISAQKSTDVALFIYEQTNKIFSKDLFKMIIQDIQKTNPIDILITSCNGQLATKAITSLLPNGSKIITLGEVSSDSEIHSTQMDDIQALSKVIQHYHIRDYGLATNRFLLETMLIDYYMHLKPSHLIKGIPTYTIAPYQTIQITDFKNDCIGKLTSFQQESLIKILCNNQDTQCIERVIPILFNWDDLKFGNNGSIELLQQSSNVSSEFGTVSAIKFANHLYCQSPYGDNFIKNADFCCLQDNQYGTCEMTITAILATSIIGICYYCYNDGN